MRLRSTPTSTSTAPTARPRRGRRDPPRDRHPRSRRRRRRERREQLPPALNGRRAIELTGPLAAAPAHRERPLRIVPAGARTRSARARGSSGATDEPGAAPRARAPPPRRERPRSPACRRRAPRTAWSGARRRRSRTVAQRHDAGVGAPRRGSGSARAAPRRAASRCDRPSRVDLARGSAAQSGPSPAIVSSTTLRSGKRGRLRPACARPGPSRACRRRAPAAARPSAAGSSGTDAKRSRSTAGGMWTSFPRACGRVAQGLDDTRRRGGDQRGAPVAQAGERVGRGGCRGRRSARRARSRSRATGPRR